MKFHPLACLLAGSLLAGGASAVHAHGIESSLERLAPLSDGRAFSGRTSSRVGLQLESRFSSGVPASDALVKLVPPDGGHPIELGRTDSQGRLTFALPAGARPDWEVQVDAGPGHRDYLELPGGGGGGHAQTRPGLPRLLATTAPLLGLGLLGCVAAAPRLRRRP